MLRKLLKYEFRCMWREFAILWPAALAVAFLTGCSLEDNGQSSGMFSVVMAMVLTGVMIALFVISVIFIIKRFNSGLLRDEGYLMFTLPVTTGKLVLSKLLTALVMIIITCVVGIASMFLLSWKFINLPQDLLGEIFRAIGIITSEEPLLWLSMFQFCIMMLVWSAASILEIYAAISIGHLFQRWRVIISVIAYIVISAIQTQLMALIGNLATLVGLGDFMRYIRIGGGEYAAANTAFLMIILLGLAFCVAYYVITTLILSKNLNLE